MVIDTPNERRMACFKLRVETARRLKVLAAEQYRSQALTITRLIDMEWERREKLAHTGRGPLPERPYDDGREA